MSKINRNIIIGITVLCCWVIGGYIGSIIEQYRVENLIQWSWESVSTDKESYGQCDTIIVSGKRSSSVDAPLESTIELVNIIDGQSVEIYRYPKRKGAVEEGTSNLAITIPLPCDQIELDQGIYHFQGTVEISFQGGTNSFSWESDEFCVSESEFPKE